MIKSYMPNGTPIFYASNWIESICYMHKEHYDKYPENVFCINTSIEDMTEILKEKTNGRKLIYVNLEHKCPIDETGNLKYCSQYWTNVFNQMNNMYFDEVWDFQIENIEYFKFHNLAHKYKFRPLRYTSWFDKYKTNDTSEFDIQIECVFDTNTRVWMINQLTNEPARVVNNKIERLDNGERISVNITNTSNSDTKFTAKNLCKYGIDMPHYDTPCTMNCTRIYEYICMNKPVIVWDRDKITSKEYFKDLCVYVEDFNTWNMKTETMKEPRRDVADAYKAMTYSDADYDNYRKAIIEDYEKRTGNIIPDSVM